jgi:hypothetical protein
LTSKQSQGTALISYLSLIVKKSRPDPWLAIGAVVAVGVALSFVVTERYHHRVLTLVFLWATMGLAWNIISGYAGQISFGHQAFFGIGAYVTVLLAAKLQLTPWLGMFAGWVAAPPCSSAPRRFASPGSTSGSPPSPIRSSSGS